MSILIGLIVTILVSIVGAVGMYCILMPMLSIVAVLAYGVDGYKLDKIADKYSLLGKKSALALMTKIIVVMALGSSLILFMVYKINPSEHFWLILSIIEFALAPTHIMINSNLKHQLAEN